MEGSEKRYFFAAAFNGKPITGNGREGVEKAKEALKKKIEKTLKLFWKFKSKVYLCSR